MCLKAYEVWDIHPDFGTVIILAESPAVAAQIFEGAFETYGPCDVRRRPELDRKAVEYSGYRSVILGHSP